MIKVLDLTIACISCLTIEEMKNFEKDKNVEKNVEEILKKNSKIISDRAKKILFENFEVKHLSYFLSKFKYSLKQSKEINLNSHEVNSLAILILYMLNKYLVKEDAFLLSILCNQEIKNKSDIKEMVYDYTFMY